MAHQLFAARDEAKASDAVAANLPFNQILEKKTTISVHFNDARYIAPSMQLANWTSKLLHSCNAFSNASQCPPRWCSEWPRKQNEKKASAT